jgi:hypothetical protein
MRFIAPDDLARFSVDELVSRTEMVVAAGEGKIAGNAAAVLLFADYSVLAAGATLVVDSPDALVALVWRVGRRAFLLDRSLSAYEAKECGLVDEISDVDFESWRNAFMLNRSELALDAGAALIRMRGGDVLERAVFAHLFACGEPQKGLAAFLGKRKAF